MLYSRKISQPARSGAIVVLALGAVVSLPAHSSVIYTSRDSSISTVVCDASGASCSTQQVTDTTLDSFSQSLGVQGSTGYASQQSQLSQSGISVSSYSEIGSSAFSVSFDIDTARSYKFSGTTSYVLGSGADVTFSVPPCEYFCSSTSQSGNFINYSVSQAGVLQPGAYTLVVDAEANGPPDYGYPASARATAQLSLSPVPLPASGVLLAMGLVPLMLLRFRAKGGGRVQDASFGVVC